MHSQRCEYQHIYKESRPNNFLFSKLTILKATYILWCIKSKTCLFIICCQLLVFPSNSVRICPIKLRFAMLYHMINTFWNIIFLDTCHCALNFAVISQNLERDLLLGFLLALIFFQIKQIYIFIQFKTGSY